jgi:ketosteroid isomerase-like protein
MKLQILLATCLIAATSFAQARNVAEDEHAVLRMDETLCKAFESGDAQTLRKGLDERFTLTDSHGNVTDRDQNLAEVTKRDPLYQEFRNHGQKVRLYGDAAIVSGITSIKATSGGKSFAGDFQFTDTYVRRDGHWLLAASHATRLP